MCRLCSYIAFASVIYLSNAAWSITPFKPPAYPLAVRTPYLSTWLPGDFGLNDNWPTFWDGSTAAWCGLMRLDNLDDQTYTFMGIPDTSAYYITTMRASQVSAKFTTTQSEFVLQAGTTGVEIVVNFISPVEPRDVLKQAIPFSYLSLSVRNEGNHTVQLYTDVSAEWLSPDSNARVNWNTTNSGNMTIHKVGLADQVLFGESGNRSSYGFLYYTTTGGSFQTASDVSARSQFALTGTLNNTQDLNYRSIRDSWPVFAFSHEWMSGGDPIVMSIGHVRDPVLQFGSGGPRRKAYWTSGYASVDDMILDFHQDFEAAINRASKLDSSVSTDAGTISPEHADIVALSIRQAFSATEITVAENDPSDVLAFMKDESNSGNVSPVDAIFAAWPLYLYFNATYGKYLLDPLLNYQANGQYPKKYSVHDLGTNYPNATGHNDGQDTAMPIEESANMLIMALSYAQKTNDLTMLTKHENLFKQWAQYLLEHAVSPDDERSTDNVGESVLVNQTNLAIKGVIGIRAMAEISRLVRNDDDRVKFNSTAMSYVAQILDLGTAPDGTHLTLTYGDSSSWGMAYNLYGDILCDLSLFPDLVYAKQSDLYENMMDEYGIPLNSEQGKHTNSAWTVWTSATMTNVQSRNLLLGKLKSWLSDGRAGSRPFGGWYGTSKEQNIEDPTGGDYKRMAVVGGHLALMPGVFTPSSSSPSPETTKRSTSDSAPGLSTGAIVGIALGLSVLGVFAVLFLVSFFVNKKRRVESSDSNSYAEVYPFSLFPAPVGSGVEDQMGIVASTGGPLPRPSGRMPVRDVHTGSVLVLADPPPSYSEFGLRAT